MTQYVDINCNGINKDDLSLNKRYTTNIHQIKKILHTLTFH